MAALAVLIDGHGKRLAHIEQELPVTFDRLVCEVEERVRVPFGPEERALLRQEFVRAGMGVVPGPENGPRWSSPSSAPVAAKLLAPPASRPASAPAEPSKALVVARAGADDLRRAASSGARLEVSEMLIPDALQSVTQRFGGWLAGAFAIGSQFGLLVALAVWS